MDTTGKPVEDDRCAKCGENDPDHVKEDCLKEIESANCQHDHPANAMSSDVYKKRRKYLRCVSFLETRKIVGTYMGENSYASVARRAYSTNEDSKYRTFEGKWIDLEANDCQKFQEHL